MEHLRSATGKRVEVDYSVKPRPGGRRHSHHRFDSLRALVRGRLKAFRAA